MQPTISIITPSFNQGRFLHAAMESVLSQEGDFFLDYLVVDGGSGDDSVDIIRGFEALVAAGAYAGKCRGITFRWSSGPDKGQADALAGGFARADGEILAWLNSDDTLLPGALAAAARSLAETPDCACVYGKGRYISESDEPVADYPTQPFRMDMLPIRNFICQPAAFFRRSAFRACGGIDASLRFAMDYDLWIRMAKTGSFLYLPDYLATYRLHGESKTVDPVASVANHGEALKMVMRHFQWAPANRVFGWCNARVRQLLPKGVAEVGAVRIPLALGLGVVEYLRLNRGVRRADLKAFNRENFGLLLSGWEGVPSVGTHPKESVKP